eukprot:1180955-Prorocentrum_minimum.AAC.5
MLIKAEGQLVGPMACAKGPPTQNQYAPPTPRPLSPPVSQPLATPTTQPTSPSTGPPPMRQPANPTKPTGFAQEQPRVYAHYAVYKCVKLLNASIQYCGDPLSLATRSSQPRGRLIGYAVPTGLQRLSDGAPGWHHARVRQRNRRPAVRLGQETSANSPPAAVYSPPPTMNSPPAAVHSPPPTMHSPPAAVASGPNMDMSWVPDPARYSTRSLASGNLEHRCRW